MILERTGFGLSNETSPASKRGRERLKKIDTHTQIISSLNPPLVTAAVASC